MPELSIKNESIMDFGAMQFQWKYLFWLMFSFGNKSSECLSNGRVDAEIPLHFWFATAMTRWLRFNFQEWTMFLVDCFEIIRTKKISSFFPSFQFCLNLLHFDLSRRTNHAHTYARRCLVVFVRWMKSTENDINEATFARTSLGCFLSSCKQCVFRIERGTFCLQRRCCAVAVVVVQFVDNLCQNGWCVMEFSIGLLLEIFVIFS